MAPFQSPETEEEGKEGCLLVCPCLAQTNLPPARPTPVHVWGPAKQEPFWVMSGSRPGGRGTNRPPLTPVLGSTYVASFLKSPISNPSQENPNPWVTVDLT